MSWCHNPRFSFVSTVVVVVLMADSAATRVKAVSQQEAWISHFQQSALPLENPADLDPLISRAADKTLVLLGESTHGTREFYEWRFHISRRLIMEHGFQFIAVEGDWEALYRLNRYVKHLPGAGKSAREILLGFDRWPQWMWANESVAELAEWLRSHNAKLPPERRTGIYGVDIYGWGDSVRALPGYLETLDEGWGEEAREKLAPLERMRGDMAVFRSDIQFERPPTTAAVDFILQRLEDNRAMYLQRDSKTFLKALISAKTIRQAKLHIRASVAGSPDAWNHRAVHFMDATARLRDHYGEGSRGILWAHNTHIGDARQTPSGTQGMLNSGQVARERLGAGRTLLVGFATRHGRVLAGFAWNGLREDMSLLPARPDSFEAWMHAAGMKRALILFDPVPEDEVLLRPAGQRAVGVVFNPLNEAGNYVLTVLPKRYDALLFFDETQSLEALHP